MIACRTFYRESWLATGLKSVTLGAVDGWLIYLAIDTLTAVAEWGS